MQETSHGQLPSALVVDGPTPMGLAKASLSQLVAETLKRIQNGSFCENDTSIRLGNAIQDRLNDALNVHNNRFSKQRLLDTYYTLHGSLENRPRIDNARVLDLGCGSVNPLGLSMLFQLMGARRTYAVDLDPVQDSRRAVRALADVIREILFDPGIVANPTIPTGAELLRRVSSFDLPALARGEISGIDSDRMQFHLRSADALDIVGDNELDLVVSNSFFEHVEDPDAVIGELARATKLGGRGVHVIDGTDHLYYGDPKLGQLDFLRSPGDATMCFGCNRIRPVAFVEIFERHGFAAEVSELQRIELDETTIAGFQEPWRSMSPACLQTTIARLDVRRVAD